VLLSDRSPSNRRIGAPPLDREGRKHLQWNWWKYFEEREDEMRRGGRRWCRE
jgi:hypothetical protein